jgi:RHS repeat-associated protein
VGPISEHTNARAHCSFQLGTTTEYGSTWLSVASSTYETCTVVQTLDYYPYGATRIRTNASGADSARKYIGQFADLSGLNFLQARYQDPQRGQFISQDPSFLAVGDPNKLQQVTGLDQRAFLADPQLANSYSYGRDNPITIKDPQGNFVFLLAALPWIYGAYTAGQVYVDYTYWRDINSISSDISRSQRLDPTLKAGNDFVTYLASRGLEQVGLRTSSVAMDTMFIAKDAVETYRDNPLFNYLQRNYVTSSASGQNGGLPLMNFGGSNYGAALSNIFSASMDSRRQAANSYNVSTGATGSGGSAPRNDSLYVTPSGAVVTFGGQLVAPPPPQTSSTNSKK